MNFIEKYQKIFAVCGMIGPFFYAMIWILGGILQPGYNHISDDVSTLLAVGAPNKLLLFLKFISKIGAPAYAKPSLFTSFKSEY